VAGKRSAGLPFRRAGDDLEVLLGTWAVRSGKEMPALDQPKRSTVLGRSRLTRSPEFQEELGVPALAGDVVELGDVRQAGGKVVTAWAVEGDFDP
jgi:predicted NUDIX family NTP pyrophosphohydrolase